MQRLLVFDHNDNFLYELSRQEVRSAVSHEEINGQHKLDIKTTRVLEKEQRILSQDATAKWREWVVTKTDSDHANGTKVVGTYVAVWSLQHDLSGLPVSLIPENESAISVLGRILSATGRWSVGTVTVDASASASMYRTTAWNALSTLIAEWGGEVDAEITVDRTSVTSRAVSLYEAQGSSHVTRRFDYGKDMDGIKRSEPSGTTYCRVIPLGRGEQTDGGGYGRKITIESVNDGKDYLQDDEVAQLVRMPSGSGYDYPTTYIENSEMETPADLKAWALKVYKQYTTPKVTYEASVVQLARAGMDVSGVQLGDVVHCVDRSFGDGGIRVQGRVTSIDENLLDPTDVKLKIGYLSRNLVGGAYASLAKISNSLSALIAATTDSSRMTPAYLDKLLEKLNDEINATGGYTYITQGQGLRTYDREVSDPLVGAEATQVVELKGGNIRIANSRTSSGDWDWKTVLQSGHILAELITTAHITAGYIGNPSGTFYADLDGQTLSIGGSGLLGGRSVSRLLQDVDATITDVDVEYAQNQSATTAPTTGWATTAPAWREGYYIWQRTSTTTADGTTHSTPVMISGRDGTSGTGIASTTTSYGTSGSASVEPTSWSQTAPTSIPTGQWLWVRTVTAYTDGTDTTAYTKSYAGTNGHDGTSVTILGSYNTLAELQAAHPTGNLGDSYIVAGDLYVWDGDSWENVGQIQGPAGQDGTSVTVSRIEYGTSTSAATQPSSWSQTVPTSIAAGRWLWVRTTYSDSSIAITKSYVGTDGQDGASVSIQSVTKSGGVTTVKLTDADGTTKTLTINDGEDGENGTAGKNGYVHTAWANSADGTTDFSTTVSANKKYLGVYTDNTAADSTSPSAYSWSLIKGADGSDAYTYTLNCSPAALVRNEQGTLTPSSITFSATRAQGTGNPTAYAGRFKIDEYNGTSWTQKYLSSSDESSKLYYPTASAEAVRCFLRPERGNSTTVLDSQSVTVLKDGAAGADGADGADAYTVILTNEAHTFAAGTSAAISSTATSYVVAYKGATQVAATIGTITGAPQGMSATIFSNGTTSARFAVSVSNLLTTKQGTLTVPVTVDGHVINRTFSWSLALSGEKGDKGDKGDTGNNGQNGVGVGEIVEQYYLSTSSTTQTGGSWSTSQPAWSSGKYIWTRSKITWSDEQITYTDPVLAKAVNGANQSAADAQSTAEAAADAADDAKKVATNYLTFSTSTGLDVGYSGTNAKTRVSGSGVEIFDNSGSSALFAGVQSTKSIVRVGRATGSGNVVMSSDGYVDVRNASTVMAHFGYGKCKDIYGNTTSLYPYYVLGEQSTDTSKLQGQHSLSGGYRSIAGPRSIAWGTECDSSDAIDAIALGNKATVKNGSLAIGAGALANAAYAAAIGLQVQAQGNSQFVIGKYNATSTSHLFIVGSGGYNARANAFYITSAGSAWLKGTLTQSSDRRLKEHHKYLDEDACEFIRKLRPALYTKDGERHLGFYAQDVQEAEPDEWDTATVTAQHTDESLDFDPLSLDYSALIAPLVAYTQQLEKTVQALTQRVEALETRCARCEQNS